MISLRMLFHQWPRFFLAVAGIGIAIFLTSAQLGLLVGWCDTNSAIIRHADADIWVIASQTPAFDYGTAIPRNRVYQVRNIEGVAWAEGLFMAWNTWQRSDGRCVNVEVVGLDESCVGGPWRMKAGDVAAVHYPETVLVDELYLKALGVERIGQEFDILGERVVVRGITEGVRTFTAAPFVFTSIKSAIRYDKRYQNDEVTYVLRTVHPGIRPIGSGTRSPDTSHMSRS